MTFKDLCDAVSAERDPEDTLSVKVEQWIESAGLGDLDIHIYSLRRGKFFHGHTPEVALASYRARGVPEIPKAEAIEAVGEIPPPQAPDPPAAPPGPPDPRSTPDYPF